QYQNTVLALLTYDDEHHRFAFADMSLLQPDGTETDRHDVIGVDHVAYTYASLHDLLKNYSRLKEKGIVPYWCVHHGITVSMYYPDRMEIRWSFRLTAMIRLKRQTISSKLTSALIRLVSSSTPTTGQPGCAPAHLSQTFWSVEFTYRS